MELEQGDSTRTASSEKAMSQRAINWLPTEMAVPLDGRISASYQRRALQMHIADYFQQAYMWNISDLR